MSKIKRRINLLICALIALTLVISFAGVSSHVRAEEIKDYVAVDVAGGQFNESSSSVLKAPSNWTGSYRGNYKGNVLAGVVDLKTDAEDFDEFMDATHLNSYKEFEKEKPSTPFGRNTSKSNEKWYFPGTNSKVLMINTNDSASNSGTAYGYASNSIDLAANSFYKLSVWVKTGEFMQDRGAVIKMSGFPYDIGFWNIDTSSEKNNEYLGFVEYNIFVATAQNTTSCTINLQVGDSYTYGEIDTDGYICHQTPSSGYAFFDNVNLTRLSANAFYTITDGLASDKILIKDFNTSAEKNSTLLTTQSGVVGSFENGINGWDIINKDHSGQPLYVGAYDASTFSDENKIGLTSAPYTPRGNADVIDDRNIAVLSSKTEANVGLESEEIEIKRNRFYVLSAWANTQNFDNGNAEMVIVGENNIPSDNFELTPVVMSDIKGGSDINVRYGWNKYFFYIQGANSKDVKIKLQLWLGYNSNCIGTVMFDEIRLEEVSYTYFNNNSTGGTLVTFDNEPTTSIDNGRFYKAENYGETLPLRPAQWTAEGELPSGAASGIIFTDEENYNSNKATYLNVENPIQQTTDVKYNYLSYPTLLLLASDKNAYFGYTSPDLSVVTNTDYKISVTLRTINMTGAGANIWVESSGVTIASIKNILSNSDFSTYEIYIQGDKPFESGTGIDYTLKLHIALGRKDAKATGSIYVAEAAMETLDSEAFDSKLSEFKEDEKTGKKLNYDIYSFSSYEYLGYDKSDDSFLKESTNWVITDNAENAQGNYDAGIFDPNNRDIGVPAAISTAYENLENKFDKIYTLRARNTALTAQLNNPIKVEANSYYMLNVYMAVVIHDGNSDTSYGAGIALNATNYDSVKFENIRTTDNLVTGYEFRQYQFYIATADEPTNLYLQVSMGDASYANRYVTGDVYVAYISLTNLGGSDDAVEESDTLKIINNHVSETDTENPDDPDAPEDDDTTDDNNNDSDTEEQAGDSERWWLIPSILFGVAILIAIIGFVVRMILDKLSRKQRAKQLNSYDRRYGMAAPEDTNEEKASEQPEKVIDQDISEFDDDIPVTETPAAPVEEPKHKEEKPHDDIENDFNE